MNRRFFLKKSVLFGASFLSVIALDENVQARQSLPDSLHSKPSENIAKELLTYQKSKLIFPPVPAEDPEHGRNRNAHLPDILEPTTAEKQAFIQEITDYALPLEKQYGVPASVIVAIAIFSSAFGRTRVAYHANNLFKLRYINRENTCPDDSCKNIETYQLVGQPNELPNTAIAITKEYGDDDRFVFDESHRSDNHYRVFSSYQECVNFLVKEVWLKNENYQAALDRYKHNVTTLGVNKAGKQFAYELAAADFVFMPPHIFQDGVARTMDEWKLYQS